MTTEIGQYAPQALPPMNQTEALEFVRWAKATQDELVRRVYEAYNRQAHLVLGYMSWAEMCEKEGLGFYKLPADKRVPAVIQLKTLGMSNRSIGWALGVDEKTVRNDARSNSADNSAPNDQEPIEGIVTSHPQGFGATEEASYTGVTEPDDDESIYPVHVRDRLISARHHLRRAKTVLGGAETRELKAQVMQLIGELNNMLARTPQ